MKKQQPQKRRAQRQRPLRHQQRHVRRLPLPRHDILVPDIAAQIPPPLRRRVARRRPEKLQRFIDNAHIKLTDHVLEIDTGWGSITI